MAKPTARALDEALEWFRARVPVTDEEFRAIKARARKLSFSIAQIEQLRIVDSVQKSLERAIRDGVGLAKWKKEIGPALRRAWGPGRRNRAGRVFNQGQRLELIYRNAMQGAYNAGRMRALRQPALRAVRPVWIYDAILDSRTSAICKSLDGTTLPADDPFWTTRTPPVHHACLVPGTAVLTSDGLKTIESLQVGDMVVTSLGRLRPIADTMVNDADALVTIRLDGGLELSATSEHPVLSGRGWVAMGSLVAGDMAQTLTGKRLAFRHRRILRVERLAYTGKVHNIAVDEDESYVAGGVVVHNCRSGIRSISQRAAMRRGLTTEVPRTRAQEGFGTSPDAGPDEVAANLEGVSPRLRELFEVKTRIPAA